MNTEVKMRIVNSEKLVFFLGHKKEQDSQEVKLRRHCYVLSVRCTNMIYSYFSRSIILIIVSFCLG